MQELEIFGRHTSYNVQKVLWLADELELNCSLVEVGGKFGGNETGDFLEMNPFGKVPVLRHGDKHIWESNTIVRYLAAEFSKGEWIASTPYERSLCERWMDWSIEKLDPAFVSVFWGFYRTPAINRNAIAINEGVAECELCLVQIGKQLAKQSYLLGENPTVADIAVGVFVHRLWAIELDIRFPENVLGWYNRLSQRPGYKRWVMSDFSELEGRAEY